MHSSYAVNNFAPVFKSIISAFNPVMCIELGVLEGYSAIAIAEGLKENFEKHGVRGHLYAYDLFEKYEFRHSTLAQAQANIDKAGLAEWVTLQQADAFLVHLLYQEQSVHFMHVDLSNTGETLRKILELWDPRIQAGGIVCFEGGSEDRDRIDWMTKYKAPSIKHELEHNFKIENKYVFGTYFRFPSMTCLLKKKA